MHGPRHPGPHGPAIRFDFRSGFAKFIEGGLQERGRDTRYADVTARDEPGGEQGAGLDTVATNRVFGTGQGPDPANDHAIAAGSVNFGAHGAEHRRELHHFGLSGGVFDHGLAAREGCRHHDVLGPVDRRYVENHPPAAEFGGRGLHVAVVESDLCAERRQSLEVLIDGPHSDRTTARLGNPSAAKAREQRSQHHERSAHLRDQIAAVGRTVERQQIVGERPVDRDVFGLAREGGEACIQVVHVREGRVVGTRDYAFSDVRLDDGEVMSSFLGQYYGRERERQVPDEVLTPGAICDDGALATLLNENAGRKVGLRAPQRGSMVDLVEMAKRNAELSLARRLDARENIDTALTELRDRLSLRALPRRVEGYDVSTLHGTLTVASRVCFENGQPRKRDYRRYRIKQAAPDDDYAALREVFRRRLARADSEPLPDLFLVDGGRGQLAVLCAALADAGLSADAVGLSKERDAESRSPRVRRSGGLKAERIFLPGRRDPVMLAPSSRGLLYLQRVRDESHRFAIEFQRSLRSKQNFTSILEELPGIGPKKRQALLRELGSLRAVRAASEAALAAVDGISPRDAATIRHFFDAFSSENGEPNGS